MLELHRFAIRINSERGIISKTVVVALRCHATRRLAAAHHDDAHERHLRDGDTRRRVGVTKYAPARDIARCVERTRQRAVGRDLRENSAGRVALALVDFRAWPSRLAPTAAPAQNSAVDAQRTRMVVARCNVDIFAWRNRVRLVPRVVNPAVDRAVGQQPANVLVPAYQLRV